MSQVDSEGMDGVIGGTGPDSVENPKGKRKSAAKGEAPKGKGNSEGGTEKETEGKAGDGTTDRNDSIDAERKGNEGNVTAATDGDRAEGIGTGAREASLIGVVDRLRREGRWGEAEGRKNQLIREYHATGLTRSEARVAAYAELDRLYPPVVAAEPSAAVQEPVAPDSASVRGLSDIPADWPALPPNASLQAEVSWVLAARVDVVTGPASVDLSRADRPAPSKAALSWLETSILYGSKFADITARATQHQEDEREHTRRERAALEDVQGLLGDMVAT